ncbi:uncharacterized protein HLK63_I00539 [Nakaseomyces glabratus]|nr:Not1 N-terminal domain, CCR4-Not complex component [Nakaseomyces glabratus]OXB42411.1 hypothetical protein B1J91_L01001g [Nakaseomyces glabratus]UCS21267.1 uncharacterized protein GW608_I00539 [Nakaseomyces glabratus]UCS26498.1 uncharacterized protein HLK63_I00539 [Nakaseomyces glabratus]UCS31728.1 uncharacterized protein HLK64_I00539 [Nakaseomyces glabratus]
MAHRKLQQEIDRVFKKINEGLDIFDSYYERHESCTNNPSQKEKLESDLKREVKKLQRLREQIKSWQSSPEIKDKDSLLEYRRSVETAMEKYKAVEKASKEKAYSNISLKKSDTLGPQEKEIKEVSDYLSQEIDELERQYEAAQIEIDRLIVLNKKKKTASAANDEKKDQLKALQLRYRWHQQQMELALRLLANEELDPQKVNAIKDDIRYFIESNREPDFVEDETIYDTLDLTSNEAIAHEVAQYFAAQSSEDNLGGENNEPIDLDSIDTSKLSKKELRKLEREAKKAAKVAAKNAAIATANAPPTISIPAAKPQSADSSIISNSDDKNDDKSNNKSESVSPIVSKIENSTANTTPRSPLVKKPTTSTPVSSRPTTTGFNTDTAEIKGSHTHIQTQNGMTSSTILKPAVVPARPAGDLKWSVAASHGIEKERKINSPPSLVATMSSRSNSITQQTNEQTPTISKTQINTTGTTLAERLEKAHEQSVSAATQINSVSEQTKPAEPQNDNAKGSMDNTSDENNNKEQEVNIDSPILEAPLFSDFSDSDYEEIESDSEEQLSLDESNTQNLKKEHLKSALSSDFEMLLLPSGIQEFIMGMDLTKNNITTTSEGKIRRSRDTCNIFRLDKVPYGVNPPSPLDAFRSAQQWDTARYSLWSSLRNNEANFNEEILMSKFESLDMFTLFYNYYFSVTPLEKQIASKVLKNREWRVANNEVMWFLRQGEPKLVNDQYEIGDYKIFKLDDWTVIDKVNFKLDYGLLKDNQKQSNTDGRDTEQNPLTGDDDNALSHGQQLLQQLKRGKDSISA